MTRTVNVPVPFKKHSEAMTEADYHQWVAEQKRLAEEEARKAEEAARLEAEIAANGGVLPGKKGDPKGAAKGGKAPPPNKATPVDKAKEQAKGRVSNHERSILII